MGRSERVAVPAKEPSLLTSREDARGKLNQQLAKGRAISNQQILNEDQLAPAKEEYNRWSKYNGELLRRIFDNDKFAREYEYWGISLIGASQSFAQEVGEFRRDVQEKLSRLESILERLELVPEPQPAGAATPVAKTKISSPAKSPGHTVFVVHGHDEATKQEVARVLEKLDLQVTILHEKPDQNKTIIEKLEAHSNVDFAVVLLTPDDVGAKATQAEALEKRARQNVVLELGYFLGKLGRGRVCALYAKGVVLPSDYSGVLYTELDGAGGWRLKLAKELAATGIPVDANKLI